MIELLEQRRLFSAVAGIELRDHTLLVRAKTAVRNAIEITSPDGTDLVATVSPEGQSSPLTQEYALATVRRIHILGGHLGDYIEIGTAYQPISLPSTVFGGAGSDTILGSTGRDYIRLGSGDDLVDGRSTDDTIIGGSGNDIVRYYPHDHIRLKPNHGQVVDGVVVPGSDPSQELSPAGIRQAYGVNSISFGGITGNGLGETIAIIGRYNDPYAASDLQQFDAVFGLPNPNFQVLNQEGQTTNLPPNATVGAPHNGALEESIDVQWAHVIAPDACIVLVEANSLSWSDISQAIQTAAGLPHVVVVSMSFGGDESVNDTKLNDLFAAPTEHPGVTFVAASGDFGQPQFPSTSPDVVAVGGTVLSVLANGDYLAESGWPGSGGGTSLYETDSFQTGAAAPRQTPDVSLDADTSLPVYDSYDFPTAPLIKAFGTSIAAPMFAGLIAIADEGRAVANLPPLTSSQTLAALYSSAANGDFHAIPSVDNGSLNQPGYSTVTGLGSPIADKLAPYLANYGG